MQDWIEPQEDCLVSYGISVVTPILCGELLINYLPPPKHSVSESCYLMPCQRYRLLGVVEEEHSRDYSDPTDRQAPPRLFTAGKMRYCVPCEAKMTRRMHACTCSGPKEHANTTGEEEEEETVSLASCCCCGADSKETATLCQIYRCRNTKSHSIINNLPSYNWKKDQRFLTSVKESLRPAGGC